MKIFSWRFETSFALGVRALTDEPKLVETAEEEYDYELALFSGVEIYFPFLTLSIGSISFVE